MAAMEFLAEDNDCGQTILRLVSRGSAIVAELLRLSLNIPGIFLGPEYVEDPEQLKYLNVLFDFNYLKAPEAFEDKVNSDGELLEIDDEFQDNFEDILERFYQLFDGIYKYISDYLEYLNNIEQGFFIQHTIDNILLDTDGAQLMCEALYLYGVMLLLLDQRIPGPTREKMVIAFYRSKGESALQNIDEVCKLCRGTGYLPGGPKPSGYPELYFKRFPPPAEVISMIIGKLQTDDVYLMASMLYVILYFAPDLLHRSRSAMREIVDRHFNDNFIATTYMGAIVDLTAEWEGYPAAVAALLNTIEPDNIAYIAERKRQQVENSLDEVEKFLTEGILTEQFVLENLNPLLNCLRKANHNIRWFMLHSRVPQSIGLLNNSDALYRIYWDNADSEKVIQLLLQTAQLERKLKLMFEALLKTKEDRWQNCKREGVERMNELSEYFSGEKPLTRVERDEQLMAWFEDIGKKISDMDYVDHIKAGRRLRKLLSALEDVEQFDQIDSSLQIKQFLAETREFLVEMIRAVNIRDEVMNQLESISDLSYGWEIINDYMGILHARIKKEPTAVILLRAVFLKLASILDVPLIRINQCNSGDVISVAEYYSGELVDYVRRVVEVIPQSVFRILKGIVGVQTYNMKDLPIKIEHTALKEYAQLDQRYTLARATHQVSVFTEGVLAMKKTLLGVIQVDPRQILEDGLRKELVYQVSVALHETLVFPSRDPEQIVEILNKLAATLTGYRVSFEYIQDYINIYGLRMWLEEFGRLMNYNVEQECNRYLKKKVYDRASQYQNRAIPIPRFPPPEGDDKHVNFMGRLMSAVFLITDPETTTYAPERCGWYSSEGKEICGLSTFSLLHRSVELSGLVGLDRMLSFRIVHTMNNLVKFWKQRVVEVLPLLDQLAEALTPEWRIPDQAGKIYESALRKVEHLMNGMLKASMIIGQAQLIRRQISYELTFSSRLDANLLSCCLETLNKSIMNDIHAHYRNPQRKVYPGENGNPVLTELNKYLDANGATDPLSKIYLTIDEPLEGLSLLLVLFVVVYMPKLAYDKNFGTLTRAREKYPVDGTPMVVGILTILKQFHPSFTRQFLAYLGQFVRSQIHERVHREQAKKRKKVEEDRDSIPVEVLNVLIFLEQFCKFSHIPRSALEGYIPAYIFDSIQVV